MWPYGVRDSQSDFDSLDLDRIESMKTRRMEPTKASPTFSNRPNSTRSVMKILPARMGPTVCEELGPTTCHVNQTLSCILSAPTSHLLVDPLIPNVATETI